MGTSTSTNGPKGTNPLIPPWAEESEDIILTTPNGQEEVINNGDIQGLSPKPNSILIDKNRFLAVRSNFTNFLKTGEKKSLNAALANYSRSSGGGGGVTKRLTNGIKSGAGLVGILSGGSASSADNTRSLSYQDLQGLTVDQAIDKLTEFLAPNDADSEVVRYALDEALSESLVGEDNFSDIIFDNDLLESILNQYLIGLILNDVIDIIGGSWKNCESPLVFAQRQNEVGELIADLVNDKVYELFKDKGNIKNLSSHEIVKLQAMLITESVESWEKYFEGEE